MPFSLKPHRFPLILSLNTVAEYCRRKGLYPEQIQQWRDEFMQPGQREERALIKKQQKEIQLLNREIARKDKALAEAAALLILEKKAKGVLRRRTRGRMTPAADRLQLMSMVQEALDAGARQHAACQGAGISERTFLRWQCSPDDRRPTAARPVPKNRLSAEEEQQVLAVSTGSGTPGTPKRAEYWLIPSGRETMRHAGSCCHC
ncbi:Transposase [Serratia ficaria]|nr:Transposase [Serratia ficaria]CAI2536884.1 Transposase [Serratia ficaria]CAI2538568.1 Transposase [Serratia ficaria]